MVFLWVGMGAIGCIGIGLMLYLLIVESEQ